MDLETVYEELDLAYREALQESLRMYFAGSFDDSESENQRNLDGTLQNIEEIYYANERLKTALQRQNLQGLRSRSLGAF